MFLYLPFEHREDIAERRRSLELFAALALFPERAEAIHYALRHHEIIAHFYRFPNSKRTLDRPSTPRQADFLQQPGSSF